jgi:hypothetical protein
VKRILGIVVLVLVAAAGAIAANLALLDYAARANDPVGKLTPRGPLPAAPASVVRPQTGTADEHHDGSDD